VRPGPPRCQPGVSEGVSRECQRGVRQLSARVSSAQLAATADSRGPGSPPVSAGRSLARLRGWPQIVSEGNDRRAITVLGDGPPAGPPRYTIRMSARIWPSRPSGPPEAVSQANEKGTCQLTRSLTMTPFFKFAFERRTQNKFRVGRESRDTTIPPRAPEKIEHLYTEHAFEFWGPAR
jgi:hypothetical protein